MIRERLFGPVRSIAVSLGAVLLAASAALAVEAAPAKPEASKAVPAAARPAKREASWVKRHEGMVDEAKKGGIDLLFIGDSITDGWRGAGKDVWKKNFEPLKAANFGIGGDRTEHLLWRLQNGELEGIAPKLAVLMIGTNNTHAGHQPEEIAAGVSAIIETVKAKCPKARVLLLAVFPRGPDAKDAKRLNNDKVNALIAKLDDGGKTVKFLDIGAKFLDADGMLSKKIMWDLLHPTARGYEIEAEAILPAVREMMGEGVPAQATGQ